MLNVNRAARTINGRAVPFDVTGRPKQRMPYRYPFGSLTWDEWPPLLIEHNWSLRVGTAYALQPLSDLGLWASFRVHDNARGDLALEKAITTHRGLSINTEDDEWHIASDGVLEFTHARIVEISLTKDPVFP